MGCVMATATLSSKSQLVLPAEIRRKLGIRPGDRVTIELADDHAVIRKASQSDVEALAAFQGEVWHGYENELERTRKEWEE